MRTRNASVWIPRGFNTALHAAGYGAGVIACLLLYGLFQERVMAYPYEGEYFPDSTWLVLYNRAFGVVFAYAMSFTVHEDMGCTAPLWKYVVVSATAVASSICQYEALKYVAFTVQILGKSCKIVPVMLWGILISGKNYVVVDWVASLGVTAAVVVFLLSGDIAAAGHRGTSGYGLLMLVGFVVADAFTAAWQERLFRVHMMSKYNQMFYINATSFAITLVSLMISGYTQASFVFIGKHPEVLVDASILSIVAVMAQWFIYSLVQEFGALVFAATMNVRQVVSVLASYVVFRHSITVVQFISLIFGAIFLFSKSSTNLFCKRHEPKPLLGEQQTLEEVKKPSSASFPSLPNISIFKSGGSGRRGPTCCPMFGHR